MKYEGGGINLIPPRLPENTTLKKPSLIRVKPFMNNVTEWSDTV